MKSREVAVQSWFPAYTFIIRTALPRETVVRVVANALVDSTGWMAVQMFPPSDQLIGHISGMSFSCRPETSMFGGRGAPLAVGEITVGEHGTDVVVRVSERLVFLIPGVFGLAGLGLWLSATTTAQVWQAVSMIGGAFLVGAAIYVLELRRVRGIFERLLLPSRSSFV